MAGAALGLRMLVGLVLLGAVCADAGVDEGLSKAVAELESLVRAQQARLDVLEKEAKAEEMPEGRRLGLIGGGVFGSSPRSYNAQLESAKSGLEQGWYVLSAAVVLFMQAGFAMLETGSCRLRNVQNVLMKNLLDVLMTTLCWWLLGWAFAFSGPFNKNLIRGQRFKENGFLGWEQFAGHHFLSVLPSGQQVPTNSIVLWFSSWAYSCVAATIATNGIAERSNVAGYLIFSFFFSGLIYPFVVAWTWGGGWLADVNIASFVDFAGSGVLHLAGGSAALVGAAIAGPRAGRFDGADQNRRLKEIPPDFAPHSPPLVVLGTLILWFGWYGLIFSRMSSMHTMEQGMLAAHAAMNTSIAASTAGIFAFVLGRAFERNDVTIFCNGILAGLVSISSCAISVETGTACGVGLGGAAVYFGSSCLLKILRIDDPMDSFSVHGAAGIWGLFAAAVFDWGKGFSHLHGPNGFRCKTKFNSRLCEDDFGGKAFLANLSETFAIMAWVLAVSGIIFMLLKVTKCLGEDEERGWDETQHVPYKGIEMEDILPKTAL